MSLYKSACLTAHEKNWEHPIRIKRDLQDRMDAKMTTSWHSWNFKQTCIPDCLDVAKVTIRWHAVCQGEGSLYCTSCSRARQGCGKSESMILQLRAPERAINSQLKAGKAMFIVVTWGERKGVKGRNVFTIDMQTRCRRESIFVAPAAPQERGAHVLGGNHTNKSGEDVPFLPSLSERRLRGHKKNSPADAALWPVLPIGCAGASIREDESMTKSKKACWTHVIHYTATLPKS